MGRLGAIFSGGASLRVVRPIWLGVISAGLFACGEQNDAPSSPGNSPSTRLSLQGPVDSACIGVSGFEIEVRVAGASAKTSTAMRRLPVLDREDCRPDEAATFPEIPLDSAVDISIRGYDGSRQLRVTGDVHIDSLKDASSSSLELQPAGLASSPIITLDRIRDVTGGTPASSLTYLEIGHQKGGRIGLTVNVSSEIEPYFGVGEPWAAAYSGVLIPGDDLVVRTSPDGPPTRMRVEAGPSGDYFVAVRSR